MKFRKESAHSCKHDSRFFLPFCMVLIVTKKVPFDTPVLSKGTMHFHSPRFHPFCFFKPLHLTITESPGRIGAAPELVFDHVPAKTLAPPDGVSLCHIRCDLLVFYALFFVFGAFSALDIFRLYHPFSGCQVLLWLKLYFSGDFLYLRLHGEFLFCLLRHFQQPERVKNPVNIRNSLRISPRSFGRSTTGLALSSCTFQHLRYAARTELQTRLLLFSRRSIQSSLV